MAPDVLVAVREPGAEAVVVPEIMVKKSFG